VTAHDREGRSVIRSDEQLTPAPIPSGDADFQLIWTTPAVPANLNDGSDGPIPAGLTLNGGSVIRVVDMLPGNSSPLHRSYSIDYGIIVSGELELELDGGDVVALSAGDIVVQRGTNHLWRNPSADTVCRIVFVLIEALAVEVGGRVLPEIHP
jgi:quercetin dioxygenase-like cupin family protein